MLAVAEWILKGIMVCKREIYSAVEDNNIVCEVTVIVSFGSEHTGTLFFENRMQKW